VSLCAKIALIVAPEGDLYVYAGVHKLYVAALS
jgi:hypothetical protein